ncbi:PilZ domain-containing protein [Desulfuromonas sp.]|uniref:PilZ domain-containing protein n=1 Tax=Desulfuromonas sp. TaxID=892 RepID=UPI0025B9C2A2|nr:PilZ domain-containing protein [Desulfuromonas sp.]
MFSRAVQNVLQDFRKCRIILSFQRGNPLELEGRVRLLDASILEVEITASPLEVLEEDGLCLIYIEQGESIHRIMGRLSGERGENGQLRFRAVEVASYPQRRRFFRIDAEVYMRYWGTDLDRPTKTVLQNVNLSGSGIRFVSSTPLVVGQTVALEVSLPGGSSPSMECVGRVVRVQDRGKEGQLAALELVEIEQEDQDEIVRFCLAEQRRQLRMKVRVRDAS